MMLVVGVVGLEGVPQKGDIPLLAARLEGARQVAAQFGGFFHGAPSEAKSEESTIRCCVGQNDRQDVFPQIKPLNCLL